MSVIGVGIDIVPISRVERLLARHGDRALRRLFTAGERDFVRTHAAPALHLAAPPRRQGSRLQGPQR